MADKDQIKRHLALTTAIKFDNIPKPTGESPNKIRVMEHVKKSLG